MPVTTGMKGGGFYDRHSTPQWNSISAVLPWLEQAIGEMDLPTDRAVLCCADYGCSEGKNSIAAKQRIIAALRRRTSLPIQTVHSDLSTNNFNQLFLNLAPDGKKAFLQDEVFSAVVGGSLYEQILPPRSVSIATTFNVLGWLSALPATPVPNYVISRDPRYPRDGVGISAQAKSAFAAQAAHDMVHFYQSRAAEMVPGGLLLAATFGAGEHRSVVDGLYEALNDSLLDVVNAGNLHRAAYESIVMPLYFRRLEEFVAPLKDAASPVAKLFHLERAETIEVPIAFNQEFAATGDAAAWTTNCTNFLRAFSEPVLRMRIENESGTSADKILDEIYNRVQSRLAADPKHYEFQYIQVAALLKRV